MKKKFIILFAFFLLIIIPYFIKTYNEYTPIKASEEAHMLYNDATKILNDSQTRINNMCIINNAEKKEYILDTKYQNNIDYDLISNTICNDILNSLNEVQILMFVSKKKDSIHFQDIKDLSLIIHYRINEYHFYNLRNTKYNLIYYYLISIHELENENSFYDLYDEFRIYKPNAKKYMISNYEKILQYELVELKFLNNTIKYFEYELANQT